jgi:hypothetical protein
MKKILALVAGSVLALSAGAGIATASVSAVELQDMLSSQMAQAGTTPDAVSCPSGLAPELGAAVTCAVTMGGETRGVTITVASVDNGQVSLSMSLAQQ